MHWIGIPFILAAAATVSAQQTSPDSGRVTITPQELQRLVEAARPKPPLPVLILAADYRIKLGEKTAEGTAVFQLQTFGEGARLAPLIGTAARIERVEPVGLALTPKDESYVLLIEGARQVKATLHFSVPLEKTEDGTKLDLPIPPSALGTLRLEAAADREVTVENATQRESSDSRPLWQLSSQPALRVSIQDKNVAPKPRMEAPALVRQATCTMRMVRDGSYLSSLSWTLRHEGALEWPLTVPAGSQLLACKINGQAASPILRDDHTLVFNLPPSRSGSESTVELSYTGKKPAFDPVRGEVSMELPTTALLVESLVWRLRLPAPYEAIAVQGNVDFQPATEPGEIRLSRELGRGDAAAVHIFYQKPELPVKS